MSTFKLIYLSGGFLVYCAICSIGALLPSAVALAVVYAIANANMSADVPVEVWLITSAVVGFIAGIIMMYINSQNNPP
jgi:hypothetical protein